MISKIKILFWVSVGLLKLSFNDFPEIYSTALETLESFISKGKNGSMNSEDLFHEAISPKFPGILQTVMKSLFNGPINVQQRSLSVLIMSWMSLTGDFTDPHKTGLFYTHIYTTLWIISRCSDLKNVYIMDESKETADVISIVKKFKQLLTQHQSDGFSTAFHALLGKDLQSVDSILDSIIESVQKKISVPVDDDRVQKLLIAIYRLHLPEYICNLTEFIFQAFNFDSKFRPALVQMIVTLWKFSRKIDTSKRIRMSLESLIQKLPFLCKEEEFEELLPPILSTASQATMKDIDLTIRDSAPDISIKEGSLGSIQQAGDWLDLLEIKSSNKFFLWS